MEVNGSGKISSLYQYNNNYDHKFFYSTGLHSHGCYLALPTIGWKWMAVASTLAYHDTVTNTAAKSFIHHTQM